MMSQDQPLALARTIQTRSLMAVAVLGAVLAGLIAFATVQISQGSPAPRQLMTVTALPTVEVAPQPLVAPPPPVEATTVIAEVEQEPVSLGELIQSGWQTAGDPPLPDHDPWAEMERPAPRTKSPTFNNRPLRKARTIRMLVTAYSPDEKSCGIWADGVTASGYSVYTNGMKLVAADTRLLPFGSIITVPGYNGGKPVPVLDRGGKIKGKRLDVLYPTHERALQWGSQYLDVTVWTYAD